MKKFLEKSTKTSLLEYMEETLIESRMGFLGELLHNCRIKCLGGNFSEIKNSITEKEKKLKIYLGRNP